MKSKNFLIVVLSVIIVILSYIILRSYNNNNNHDLKEIFEKYDAYTEYTPKDGYVPDEKTAIQIAEATWIGMWKDYLDTSASKPFMAVYDKKYDIWYVRGSVPKGSFGAIPQAIIRRRDGRILAAWGG